MEGTVTELVEGLANHPDFRGLIIFDPLHLDGAVIPPTADFKSRWRNCDPLILSAEMVPAFARQREPKPDTTAS